MQLPPALKKNREKSRGAAVPTLLFPGQGMNMYFNNFLPSNNAFFSGWLTESQLPAVISVLTLYGVLVRQV